MTVKRLRGRIRDIVKMAVRSWKTSQTIMDRDDKPREIAKYNEGKIVDDVTHEVFRAVLCPSCRPRDVVTGGVGPPDEDGGPWQQNNVRILEDG
jgi:hypothetical protein